MLLLVWNKLVLPWLALTVGSLLSRFTAHQLSMNICSTKPIIVLNNLEYIKATGSLQTGSASLVPEGSCGDFVKIFGRLSVTKSKSPHSQVFFVWVPPLWDTPSFVPRPFPGHSQAVDGSPSKMVPLDCP